MKSTRKLWILLAFAAGFILILIWYRSSPVHVLFSDQQLLTNWLQQWGAWVPFITIGLHVAQVLAAPIPGTAIDAANGYLFGVWLGTLYSMIGLITGSMIMLLLVRKYGRPLAERFVSTEKLQLFDSQVARYGAIFIFLIFLFPFMPDDLMIIVAGLTSMPLIELFSLALVGRLPGVFVANWLGSRAPTLATWQWIVLASLFLILMLFFWRVRHLLVENMSKAAERISRSWHHLKQNNH